MSDINDPSLIDLVLKFVREQFPEANVTILYRWGKEIRVNNITAGCIINNRWETWHWENRDVKGEVEHPDYRFKIVSDVRITEKSIHVSDPSFFDIIKQDCHEVIFYGK